MQPDELIKKQGDFYQVPDIFSDIYGNISVAETPNSPSWPILRHHFEELTQGSGLHVSTLARTGVRSYTSPKEIYHILSRHDNVPKEDVRSQRSLKTLSNDGKAILTFFNPLMPSECHSKKDGFTYLAAKGSCKPPLIWAPQASVNDYNRAFLVSVYGEKLVDSVAERLVAFQEQEKAAVKLWLQKQLQSRGFLRERAALVASNLFSLSGMSGHYSALTSDAPIEVTEGQKKMYCMAQSKENQMLGQLVDTVGTLSSSMSDEQIESKLRGVDFIRAPLYVCAPGVWMIIGKNPINDPNVKYVLNESWKGMIDFTDRDLVMTWDADAAYNPEVANAAQWTGWAVQREFKGSSVSWRLFDENKKIIKEDGSPVKIGSDDFIRHFGPDAFFDMKVCPIATGIPRAQLISGANALCKERGEPVNFIGYLEHEYMNRSRKSFAHDTDSFDFGA